MLVLLQGVARGAVSPSLRATLGGREAQLTNTARDRNRAEAWAAAPANEASGAAAKRRGSDIFGCSSPYWETNSGNKVTRDQTYCGPRG